MTGFDRALEKSEIRLAVVGKFPDFLALGRWVNPAVGVFGALVFGGFLFTADPTTPDETPRPPTLAMQTAPSTPVWRQPAARGDTAIVAHLDAAQESTPTSTTVLLEAVLGASLAFVASLIGLWLGVRHGRALTQVDEHSNDSSAPTVSMSSDFRAQPRGPTCWRMHDETVLVPAYLRRAAFPATKSDLLGLAAVYADEGRALRRIEQVTDRRYTSLHDLITELYVD